MDDSPGLTPYIVALILHRDLPRADPARAAERYGIPLAWAEYYFQREIERRRALR